MNDRFFPDGVDWSLGLAAFANDPFLVHFLHRWWAWVLVVLLVIFARRVRAAGQPAPPRSPSIRRSALRYCSASSPSSAALPCGWRRFTRRSARCWSRRPSGARMSSGAGAMTIVSVYCVFADAEEAERIGRQMVEERLAACVNILGAVPVDLPLARQGRGGRRGRRHLQDHRRRGARRWSPASPSCTATTCRASRCGRCDGARGLCGLGRGQRPAPQ